MQLLHFLSDLFAAFDVRGVLNSEKHLKADKIFSNSEKSKQGDPLRVVSFLEM